MGDANAERLAKIPVKDDLSNPRLSIDSVTDCGEIVFHSPYCLMHVANLAGDRQFAKTLSAGKNRGSSESDRHGWQRRGARGEFATWHWIQQKELPCRIPRAEKRNPAPAEPDIIMESGATIDVKTQQGPNLLVPRDQWPHENVIVRIKEESMCIHRLLGWIFREEAEKVRVTVDIRISGSNQLFKSYRIDREHLRPAESFLPFLRVYK